jgi:hypothetical protein
MQSAGFIENLDSNRMGLYTGAEQGLAPVMAITATISFSRTAQVFTPNGSGDYLQREMDRVRFPLDYNQSRPARSEMSVDRNVTARRRATSSEQQVGG